MDISTLQLTLIIIAVVLFCLPFFLWAISKFMIAVLRISKPLLSFLVKLLMPILIIAALILIVVAIFV
ncbi:hypothetical protein NPX79_00715 [Spiroplasma endosymbiont of Anurida maritima]|uniref:hypothetical protein n=1 Tax=Spiroplasma endosymbiont of Anurida maritima TaxID=2967972 RepID=UPI0036D2F31C